MKQKTVDVPSTQQSDAEVADSEVSDENPFNKMGLPAEKTVNMASGITLKGVRGSKAISVTMRLRGNVRTGGWFSAERGGQMGRHRRHRAYPEFRVPEA